MDEKGRADEVGDQEKVCGEAAAATGTACSACRLCPGWPAADDPQGDVCDLPILYSGVFAMRKQLFILAGN